MEDPDSTDQLPLPSMQDGPAAQTIKLSLPSISATSTAQIVKLPLPANAPDQVVKHRLPAKSSRGDAVVKRSNKLKGSLWYALYFPQLAELTESQQKKHLNDLAGLVQSVSSTVSFHPLALICEIRSSLKYFGGINVIHDKLKQLISTQLQVQGLPDYFLYAASPTVTGSLLLARSGHNALVYQKDNLRSALGQLPTEVLQLDKEQNRRLYNMGVRYLRDIWRLPGDGLRKRFGSDFVKQLNKALGTIPEPTRNYMPPPAFTTSYDLPYELENLDRLLPIADEMLAQLCDFLRRRDLSTSHLLFSLRHEKRRSTDINLGLRQPSRSREHLMLLLETHFGNLTIPAPVTALKVEVKKFDAFMSRSNSLLVEGKPTTDRYCDSNLNQFMEQLQARLGDHHLKSISSVAEHCPEYASRQLDYGEPNKAGQSITPGGEPVALNPRPFWLLQEPLQLTLKNGKLYHRKPISIVSGPERLETYWWSGADVRRDYYVAREQNGSRLWIYREKIGAKHWYLHGLFA